MIAEPAVRHNFFHYYLMRSIGSYMELRSGVQYVRAKLGPSYDVDA